MASDSRWPGSGLLLALLVCAVGCKKDAPELETAVAPKTYAFVGQIDKKFAGLWMTADGNSSLNLVKDGTLGIDTVSHSNKGATTSHVSGQWKVTGGSLLFEYAGAGDKATVLKYSATLAGKSLTLQQAGGRMKTTYKRK